MAGISGIYGCSFLQKMLMYGNVQVLAHPHIIMFPERQAIVVDLRQNHGEQWPKMDLWLSYPCLLLSWDALRNVVLYEIWYVPWSTSPVSRGIPDDEKMTENCLSWDTRRVKLNIYIYTEVKWRKSTCYGISAKHPETGHAPHQWHRSPSQICLRKMLVTKPARYVYNIIIYYILYYIILYHIILYYIIIYYILYYSILYIIL